MANDYAEYNVVPSAEATKDEIIFKLNAFQNTDKYSGLIALAMKVRDLLLMEPGTHPGAITMGVGIKNYLMEFLDDVTLDGLSSLTNSQIKEFLPNQDIKNVSFIRNPEDNDRNKLYLVVYLNKTAEEFNSSSFALGLSSKSVLTSNVLSDIYI